MCVVIICCSLTCHQLTALSDNSVSCLEYTILKLFYTTVTVARDQKVLMCTARCNN